MERPTRVRPPASPRRPDAGEGPVAGTLFVVATPIGNLDDITLRALRVLAEAAAIAAEDTRRTSNLLHRHGIQTPLISLHAYNERRRVPELIEKLRSGRSIALVSDAGTPSISDPGAMLVRSAREVGIRVEPIPGASAVTAALSASGLSSDRFAFGGFPPTAARARAKWLTWIRDSSDIPVVFFEAPHRIRRTLEELVPILVNRQIIVGRELTKVHEEWLTGTAAELAQLVRAGRGEYVLVVASSNEPADTADGASDDQVLELFGQITEINKTSRREAIRATAKRLGLSPRAVYSAIERSKHGADIG